MFTIAKIGGIWQIWNVTCDGSIIVENAHRNMGFLQKHAGKRVRALVNALKSMKPAFSLSTDFSRAVLDSNLEKDTDGFHVFDYAQLDDAGIDINSFVDVTDFRLGSFVVFEGNIFTADRIADELDVYPGHPFLRRHLKGQKPAMIDLTETSEIGIPSRKDVKNKLLEIARESWCSDYKQCDQYKLEEEIGNYIDTFCYPDLDLKIPFPCCGK